MQAKRQRLADRPDIILAATDAVLRRDGARALTIDAVAEAAGISKGGVLYHYGSKDALVLALVTRKLRDLRESIEAYEAALPAGARRPERATLAHARQTYADDDGFSRALILGSVENPEALDGYRTFVAERLDELGGRTGEGGQGMALFFAVLGLNLGRTLGFHELVAAEVAPMFDALDQMAARTRRSRRRRAAGRGEPTEPVPVP